MVIRESNSEKVLSCFTYICIVLLCIATLYPFIYVIMYSFSNGNAASAVTITFYPVKPTWENYKSVFLNNDIMNSFLISVLRTILGAGLHLLVTSMAAYTLSKNYLVGKRKILVYFIVPMYFSGGLLPLYVLISKIHLTNNFLVYILPMVFSTFNMLLMKVFFEQLPASLEESAKIDGAGDFTVFFRIILPSSLPIIATVAMFIGVDQWNAWFDALLYVTKQNLMPLQTLLYKIILESQASSIEEIMRKSQVKSSVTPEAIKMTTLVVSTVPIILIYPFLQKYFVKGMMVGAVKG